MKVCRQGICVHSMNTKTKAISQKETIKMMESQSQNQKRIFSVQGVQIEADPQSAEEVKRYKVGDAVKVRWKKTYSDSYDTYPGVIINFTNFDNLPTLEILYVRSDYSGASIEFLAFNAKSKGVEITPISEYESLFNRLDIQDKLDRAINLKEEELRILKAKKKAFLSCFSPLEG